MVALVAGSMELALALVVEQTRIVAVVVVVVVARWQPIVAVVEAIAAMVGSIVGCSSYVCNTGTFFFCCLDFLLLQIELLAFFLFCFL